MLDVGVVGCDVHHGADRFTALAHGVCLEQLADLIKQHYEHRLRVLADAERTDGCQCHKKVFVEDLTVKDVFHCLDKHGVTYNGIRDEIKRKPEDSLYRYKNCGDEENQRDGYADKQFFLFVCHFGVASLPVTLQRPLVCREIQMIILR